MNIHKKSVKTNCTIDGVNCCNAISRSCPIGNIREIKSA